MLSLIVVILGGTLSAVDSVCAQGMQLLSPINGATNVQVKGLSFSWVPVAGATEYRFMLATDPGVTKVVREELVKGTSYTYSADLQYNAAYFWRVMIYKPAPGQWSPTFGFYTQAAPAPLPALPPATQPASSTTMYGPKSITLDYKPNYPWWLLILIAAVVIVGGFFAYRRFAIARAGAPSAPVTEPAPRAKPTTKAAAPQEKKVVTKRTMAPKAAPARKSNFCTKCGAPLRAGAKFCTKCGKKLK